MRFLICILVGWLATVSFATSSVNSANTEALTKLDQCVAQLKSLDSQSQRVLFPRGTFAWQIDVLETTAKQLSRINQQASAPDAAQYLYVNAVEGCRAIQAKMELLARRFSLFLVGLVTTLLSLTAYFIVLAIPSKLGLPDRRKKPEPASPSSPQRDRKISGWWFVLLLPGSLMARDTLVVFGYDSLFGKGSLGELVAKRFEEKHQAKVRNVSFSSEGEALNQIILKGSKSEADVLVGVDNVLLRRAVKSDRFVPLDKAWLGASPLQPVDESGQFLPFDYGYLAFVYDSERTSQLEKITSLGQLVSDTTLKKRIVIEDPRTSSIGLSFLAWTKLAFPDGKKWESFWRGFSAQLLTISPGWSGAYGLFLNGEANLVLSYTTSPAYHLENEKKANYTFLNFSESGGHFQQTEFVGVLKASKQRGLAEKYVQLLLSEEIQKEIPTHQWMYPVRKGTPLPASFAKLAVPKGLSLVLEEADRARWVQEWTRLQTM